MFASPTGLIPHGSLKMLSRHPMVLLLHLVENHWPGHPPTLPPGQEGGEGRQLGMEAAGGSSMAQGPVLGKFQKGNKNGAGKRAGVRAGGSWGGSREYSCLHHPIQCTQVLRHCGCTVPPPVHSTPLQCGETLPPSPRFSLSTVAVQLQPLTELRHRWDSTVVPATPTTAGAGTRGSPHPSESPALLSTLLKLSQCSPLLSPPWLSPARQVCGYQVPQGPS